MQSRPMDLVYVKYEKRQHEFRLDAKFDAFANESNSNHKENGAKKLYEEKRKIASSRFFIIQSRCLGLNPTNEHLQEK